MSATGAKQLGGPLLTQLQQLSDDLINMASQVPAVKLIFDKAAEAGVSKYVLLVGTLFLVLFSLTLTLPKEDEKGALDEKEFRAFTLVEREEVSHDVRRFRFALQHNNQLLGLPIGQHITLRYVDKATGDEVQRSYTPVTSDDERGYVDFVIKVYKPLPPRFPNGGAMSQHLDGLKLGDTIMMRGPKGELDYQGQGRFRVTHGFGSKKTIDDYSVTKLGLIAGGTGITPMLQIIRAVLKNPQDKTQLWLIFANKTEDDILLREELEAIPKSRLKLFYTLDEPPKGWKGGAGFISEEMCKNHLPAPGPDVMIFNCGPPVRLRAAAAAAAVVVALVAFQSV